jgi:hypothetical protein
MGFLLNQEDTKHFGAISGYIASKRVDFWCDRGYSAIQVLTLLGVVLDLTAFFE